MGLIAGFLYSILLLVASYTTPTVSEAITGVFSYTVFGTIGGFVTSTASGLALTGLIKAAPRFNNTTIGRVIIAFVAAICGALVLLLAQVCFLLSTAALVFATSRIVLFLVVLPFVIGFVLLWVIGFRVASKTPLPTQV